jgi:hypothetical protein
MRSFVFLILLLATASARADFYSLDRNGDGYVSRIEAAADKDIAARFDQFDLDVDGRLSPKEYAALIADNEKRAAENNALVLRPALAREKPAPSLAISVATPGEAPTLAPLPPLIPQNGLFVRVGVQWTF